jgi:hypothetical protein
VSPEIIVTIVAVFVSGGALGAAGTLLGQWILRKMQGPEADRRLSPGDIDLLRRDVHELANKVHSIDVRLDFTEQLIGGALPTSRPASALESGETDDTEARGAD